MTASATHFSSYEQFQFANGVFRIACPRCSLSPLNPCAANINYRQQKIYMLLYFVLGDLVQPPALFNFASFPSPQRAWTHRPQKRALTCEAGTRTVRANTYRNISNASVKDFSESPRVSINSESFWDQLKTPLGLIQNRFGINSITRVLFKSRSAQLSHRVVTDSKANWGC